MAKRSSFGSAQLPASAATMVDGELLICKLCALRDRRQRQGITRLETLIESGELTLVCSEPNMSELQYPNESREYRDARDDCSTTNKSS